MHSMRGHSSSPKSLIFFASSTHWFETTVEAVRQRARAKVAATPFYNPPQKMALPATPSVPPSGR